MSVSSTWADFVKWIKKVFSGGGSGGGSTPALVKCPPVGAPGTMRGVSMDYNWDKVDFDAYFAMLAINGCNGTGIEFWMWSGCYDINRGLEPLKAPYQRAVTAARKYGGTLFVSLCNDNQGSGKYKDTRKKWEKYDGLAKASLDFIIACGPANVIVQPVSETQTSWGSGFERTAMAKLNAAGFVTCYNHGSRPKEPGAGSDRNAYHPFKMEDVATAGDIIVTDTGTIITALQDGGIYGTTFNDQRVATYAQRVKAAGQRDLLIYGFTGVVGMDEGAVAAVGQAWK